MKKKMKKRMKKKERTPVICSKSYWIYTNYGGVLTVEPELTQWIKKGEKIATVRNIFGEILKKYEAPEDGIVIGKATNPVNQSGDIILHLGIVGNNFKRIMESGGEG